ncbi:MAG: PFIG00823557: AC2 (Proteasome assembly chaperone) family, partial [uncultured Actinomycetospora sp.]
VPVRRPYRRARPHRTERGRGDVSAGQRRERGPRHARRVRGLERRRGRREHRGRAPRAALGRHRADRDRPRRVLRLPGLAAHRAPRGRRQPRHRLAHHAAPPLPPARLGAGPHPRARHRAQHALARLLRRGHRAGPGAGRRHGDHARGAAGRHPAHAPGTGHRHVVRQGLRRAVPAAALALPGAHRHRRGPPGRLRAGGLPGHLVLGRRAALRLPAARAEGHDRAAAAGRGGPRRRGAARRAARAGREVGAHGLGDGRRGRRGARVRQGPRGGRRRRDRPRGGLGRGDRRRLRAVPPSARSRRHGRWPARPRQGSLGAV